MAKSIIRFQLNRESVVLFENSNPSESSKKHPGFEDHMRRINGTKFQLKFANHKLRIPRRDWLLLK